MAKQSFGSYGTLVAVVIIVALMISFATPFGAHITEGVKNLVLGFDDAGQAGLDGMETDQSGNGGSWGGGAGSSGQKLATPINVRVENNYLLFDLVENADEYIITIGDNAPTTYATSPIDLTAYLTAPGTVTVTVVALDRDGSYANSDAGSVTIELEEKPHVDEATGEILDSWEQIITSVNDGTYATKYSVGDYKPLDLGSEGVINMQIAAMDTDVLSDGSGNAHITWIAMELLATKHNMNSTSTNNGGWAVSEMRTYLSEDVWTLIPEVVQSAIVAVDKTYYNLTNKSTLTCSDKLWIPSQREVLGNKEEFGVIYSELFTDDNSRIRALSGSNCNWWLRSAHTYNTSYFNYIGVRGASNQGGATVEHGVLLSFCM